MRFSILALALLSGCSLYFGGGDSPPSSDAAVSPGARRVFVTSALYQAGTLGGVDGGDAICAHHAQIAGLSGTFRAWLSDATRWPATSMTHGSSDYVLVDNTIVAHGWADLTDGELLHAIDHDEDGKLHQTDGSCMGQMGAWTATDFDGAVMPPDGAGVDYSCGGWTDLHGRGLLGRVQDTSQRWSNDGYGCAMLCTTRAALYCFEQ
jgi:hypothetical protein